MKITTSTKQVIALISFLGISSLAHAQTFNFATFDEPSAGTGPGQGTWGYGISGSTVVGYYGNIDGGRHAFYYNGSSYATLDYPGIPNFTIALGVDANNVVGMYSTGGYGVPNYGYLYNGSTYTSLTDPSANGVTIAEGVSGAKIVGYYLASGSVMHGFLYNVIGGNYSNLDDPLAGSGGNQGTFAYGISGNNIVGGYRDSSEHAHGFLYNGSSFLTIDDPFASNAASDYGTVINGISGGNMVGNYQDAAGKTHGFYYDGTSFTTIDDPLGTQGTTAQGIYGNLIVGSYFDSSGTTHGYIARVVPEPSTSCLVAFGLTALYAYRKRLSRHETEFREGKALPKTLRLTFGTR